MMRYFGAARSRRLSDTDFSDGTTSRILALYACTIPCGLTTDGLPIGLQLVGPMFDDALVLRAARAYEAVRPIARPPLRFATA